MAAQSVLAFINTYIPAEIDAWADAAALRMKAKLEELSPSPDHSENIYATGQMRDSWRIENLGLGTRRLVNDAPHAGYADEGYTRWKGKASARPWDARGGRDYTQQAVDAVMPELDDDYMRRLGGIRADR